MRPAVAAGLALTFVLAGALPVPAQFVPLPNVGPRPLLRLEGVIEHSHDAAKRHGFTVTSFGFLGAPASVERWLGVTLARTVGGDQAVNGKTVLLNVSMWQPNFLVSGPPDLSAVLQAFAPGTRVEIEGLLVRGPNGYLLRSVRALTADSPAAG